MSDVTSDPREEVLDRMFQACYYGGSLGNDLDWSITIHEDLASLGEADPGRRRIARGRIASVIADGYDLGLDWREVTGRVMIYLQSGVNPFGVELARERELNEQEETGG